MNKKNSIKTVQWLLASYLLASIIASTLNSFCCELRRRLGHNSIEQYTD